MGLRAYDTHPVESVVRGDDEMLITPYMMSTAGNNSPTMGITASLAPKMFSHYAQKFTSRWDRAREYA
jgi:hypothetical protein